MFDLWRKINEEGEAAIPANPSGLSALEWCEVGEQYPHLVPEEFRGFEPFSSPFLIRTSPFVNEKGNEYLFVATSPDNIPAKARGEMWYNSAASLRSEDEARREPECRIQGIVARQVPRMDLRFCVKCGIYMPEQKFIEFMIKPVE